MSPWRAISLGDVEHRRHRRAAPLHECITGSAFCSLCEPYVNIVVISLTVTWCVWIIVWTTMLLITRSSSHITGWIPAMTGVVITRSKDIWNFGISLVNLVRASNRIEVSWQNNGIQSERWLSLCFYVILVLRTVLDKQLHPEHRLLSLLLINTINTYLVTENFP